MSKTYDTEQGELQAKQRDLEGAIAKTEEVFSNIENFTHLITRYTNIEQLDTRILNELIDRIEVHEKVLELDGQKSQRVDIYYKFIGYIPMEPEGVEEFEEMW